MKEIEWEVIYYYFNSIVTVIKNVVFGIRSMSVELVLGVVRITVPRWVGARHIYREGALKRRMWLQYSIAAVSLEKSVIGSDIRFAIQDRTKKTE